MTPAAPYLSSQSSQSRLAKNCSKLKHFESKEFSGSFVFIFSRKGERYKYADRPRENLWLFCIFHTKISIFDIWSSLAQIGSPEWVQIFNSSAQLSMHWKFAPILFHWKTEGVKFFHRLQSSPHFDCYFINFFSF